MSSSQHLAIFYVPVFEEKLKIRIFYKKLPKIFNIVVLFSNIVHFCAVSTHKSQVYKLYFNVYLLSSLKGVLVFYFYSLILKVGDQIICVLVNGNFTFALSLLFFR